jgi:hypothetical protein
MLGIKRNRKPAAQPQVITKVVYRTSPEDQAKLDRLEKTVKLMEHEYAHRSQSVNQELDKRDAGERCDQKGVDRDLGYMHSLSEGITRLTGKDPIVVSFQLDKMAQGRRDEVFPYTSLMSTLSPIWPEGAEKKQYV